MNVQPISAAQNHHKKNNQPVFKGYVDKSFEKLIDAATQNSINNVISTFNNKGKKIKPEELKQLKEIGKNVKKIFSEFMAPFHPQTVLTTDGNKALIKNSVTDTSIEFANFFKQHENNGKIYGRVINVYDPIFSMPKGVDIYDSLYKRTDLNKLGFWHLKEFKTFAKRLQVLVSPKEVDSELFDRFTKKLRKEANTTSIIKYFLSKQKAKKADKLAPEFDKPTGWVEKVKSIRAEARKQSAIKKAVTSENKKIAKQILKEQ